MKWNNVVDCAFHQLKEAFTSAAILKYPNPELLIVVEVDALETAVQAFLSQQSGKKQKLYPVAFFSHKLTSSERNYDIDNWELLAVKPALEEWRFYSLHWPQEPGISAKRPNPCQARWPLFFSFIFFLRFRFVLSYRPVSKKTQINWGSEDPTHITSYMLSEYNPVGLRQWIGQHTTMSCA